MTIELTDSNWDQLLAKAVASRQPEVRIVCPFIKHRACKRLFHTDHRPRFQVITRFNLADFCSGVSDLHALRLLLENGAEIRGIKGLHAKLYLFGNSQSMVTSANLTEAALLRNHEFGFHSADASVAACCREYFDKLWQSGGSNLTLQQLVEWEVFLSNAMAGGLPPTLSLSLPDHGSSHSVPPFELPGATANEIPPIYSEAGQSFVKFMGTGTDRSPLSSSVFEELELSGCHWACSYPRGKRPRIVQDGAVIFMARLVNDGDIIIIGRAIAIKHVDRRDDATDADTQFPGRDWKENWPHYIRVHHAEFLAGSLENGVRLSNLMAELGSDAFASTQENAAKGSGNVNPRTAYQRKPAVRLSPEGLQWVNARLEQAFLKHGKLSPGVMAKLDWPAVPSL